MKKFLLLGIGSTASFVGTVLGLLAAQGRLNHDGVQGIPLLSAFFPAPPPSSEGASSPAGHSLDQAPPQAGAGRDPGIDAAAGADKGESNAAEWTRSEGLGKEKPVPYRQGASLFQGERGGGAEAKGAAEKQTRDQGAVASDPAAEQSAAVAAGSDKAKGGANPPPESSSEWKAKVDAVLGQGQYRPGRLWSFPQLEAGISVDDLNEIVRRAREERAAVERDRAALQQQRSELLARERDVADRQDAVLEKLREVEQLRAKVQAEIDEFHNTVLLIRQDEVSGLQAVAKTLGAVEPKTAAAVIKKWWETDEGQSRALKTWTVMDVDAANAILGELDVEMIRQVLEKRLKVVRQQAGAKK